MENKEKENVKIYNENHMENCNVFQGPVYGASFPLPGVEQHITQHFGAATENENKAKKEQAANHSTQISKAREKEKTMVMKTITSAFNFDEKMLGRDNKGSNLTNNDIRSLFRNCFGIGRYPSKEENEIIEKLWGLLIDKRAKCAKDAKQGFIPQTLLNIIGYFKEKGLVSGTQLDLAKCVYKSADDTLAKNVGRNIPASVFPYGTAKMFDSCIEKVLNRD